MKRLISMLMICLCILLTYTSCAPNAVEDEIAVDVDSEETFSPTDVPTAEPTATSAPTPNYMGTSPARTVGEGANRFAFQLSAALAKEAGDENFVCSPFSVWLPLSALVNATREQQKDELIAALGTAGYNEEEINAAAKLMAESLTSGRTEQAEPLKIANAVFVDNDLTIRDEFMRTYSEYFWGDVLDVDFSSPEAVKTVNQWASDHTDGLITNVIDEFPPDVVAAIANAIYFSDSWFSKFSPDFTEELDFHARSGDVKAPFMYRKGVFPKYYEDDKVQALPLLFSNGGGLYILLPKEEDATDYLCSMTSDYFYEMYENGVHGEGSLLLPRFSIESDPMDLADSLKAMGVPLFDVSDAPLTGGLVKEQIPVWLGSAVQKALVEVDEEGATAAAVTVMSASTASMPMVQTKFTMNCDKPFAFILFGQVEGDIQVLFTGIVNQP